MRYHFHLRERGGYIPDEEGLELANLEAAREAAVAGARSIIADEVVQGKIPLASVLEVEDENGNRVLELAFRDTVALDG